MSNTEEIQKWYYRIIIHLAVNKDSWVNYYDLENEINVPEQYRLHLWNKFWNASGRRLIDGQMGHKKRMVKINQHGLDYADQLESNVFESIGSFIFDTPITMDINDACKYLFDLHKVNQGMLTWHKQSFPKPRPNNLNDIKAILIRKGIIFQSSSNKTILDPIVMNANSYEEAGKILEDKNPKVPQIHFEDKSTTITESIFNDSQFIQGSSLVDSDITHKVITTPSKNERKEINKAWYSKPLFKYFIWPVVVGLVIYGLVYLINNY